LKPTRKKLYAEDGPYREAAPMEYMIEVKAYSLIPYAELPLILPLELYTHGQLPPGYHRFVVDLNKKEMEKLVNSIYKQSDLKLIGVHKK
jgi:hypothetical protein